MTKNILLTGATGFIGRNVARLLSAKKHDFTVLVRLGTSASKLKNLPANSDIVKIDLSDIKALKNYLDQNSFKTVIHIGALRGGRNYPQKTFYDANVKATEQIVLNSLKNDSRLIYCSSVGVYGAIPQELPAHINTVYQNDNFYHDTKIKAEAIIKKYILSGLKAVILRPAITYGEQDFGFPYTLVKLIHHRLLFIPDLPIRIHLANVDMVAEAFYKLSEREVHENKIYNLADRYPTVLQDLVDFISNRLRQKPYPESRYISALYFHKMSKFFSRYGMSNMHNRVKLLSNNWFYNSSDVYNDLGLRQTKTIPDFKVVVDWYMKRHAR